MTPQMLNLLGCSKENFKKLISKMNYRIIEENNEIYFRYSPLKKHKKSFTKKTDKENPFDVLKNINFN